MIIYKVVPLSSAPIQTFAWSVYDRLWLCHRCKLSGHFGLIYHMKVAIASVSFAIATPSHVLSPPLCSMSRSDQKLTKRSLHLTVLTLPNGKLKFLWTLRKRGRKREYPNSGVCESWQVWASIATTTAAGPWVRTEVYLVRRHKCRSAKKGKGRMWVLQRRVQATAARTASYIQSRPTGKSSWLKQQRAISGNAFDDDGWAFEASGWENSN